MGICSNNEVNSDEWINHEIFNKLKEIIDFYKLISFQVYWFITMWVKWVLTLDTYIFSSLQHSIDSINYTLSKWRINDSYALLRKFHDSCIMHIYINIYLENNFNIDNMVVEKVQKWIEWTSKFPRYKWMKNYIDNHDKFKDLNKYFYKDNSIELIRERCNDHTHYNSYASLLINDWEIYLKYRLSKLNQFSNDLEKIFLLHISYLFNFSDHYMSSSDYRDCLDVWVEPPAWSEQWVAPFIQDIIDKYMKKEDDTLLNIIKNNSAMDIK